MYINANTLEIYSGLVQVREAFPNTCFPVSLTNEILESFSIFPITKTTPVYNEILETSIEQTPELIYGVWTQKWLITPKYSTQEEIDQAIANHLNHLKMMKNEEINEARLASNGGTFIHLGYEISCDALSRSDIEATNGIIILNNALPPNWVGFWKTANNQYIPILTVEEWKAFYTSMFNRGSSNFIYAQQLKAQVAAAKTIEELAAIQWVENRT